MCDVNISKNKIKEIAKLQQKKYRDLSSLFIAEGEKAYQELLEEKIHIEEVFSLKKRENTNLIDEKTMKKISSTATVCEILAVAKKRNYELEEFKKLNNIVLLESVSDPGNLGTIIRSAAAFGVEGIILYGDCVDLYSPKVVRACCGNLFKIPVIRINSLQKLNEPFKNHVKISTSLSKNNNITLEECKEIKKRIIMFGAEATGLSRELTEISEKNIKLEMQNRVDSLNLAVCASVIMYEISGIKINKKCL